MLVELVGDWPEQEIRIIKRDNIDRSENNGHDDENDVGEQQEYNENGPAQATGEQGEAWVAPDTDEAQ